MKLVVNKLCLSDSSATLIKIFLFVFVLLKGAHIICFQTAAILLCQKMHQIIEDKKFQIEVTFSARQSNSLDSYLRASKKRNIQLRKKTNPGDIKCEVAAWVERRFAIDEITCRAKARDK